MLGSLVVGAFCLLILTNAKIVYEVQRNDFESQYEDYACFEGILEEIIMKLEQLNVTLSKQISELDRRYTEYLLKLKEQTRSEEDLKAKPRSCAEAMSADGENGIYEVFLPESNFKPFKVYCIKDLKSGPAWTMISRRQDGSVDFYRGYFEYKVGFGNLKGEFFIGLEKLYILTNYAEPQELWVQLEDFDGKIRFAKYESFIIEDDNTNYMLKVLGKYSGTAGDGLGIHVEMKFVTKDSYIEDYYWINCAILYEGAWWYGNCHDSNLFGPYLERAVEDGQGIDWYPWHSHESLKYAHMAIRPIQPLD